MSCGRPHYMPLPGASEDASQTARLADELSLAIHLGDLKSGEPLREVELAEAHGVSRTIVRAALQRLEAQGLADIALNKGEDALKAKVNEVISGMKKDGSLNEVSKKWLMLPLPANL